MALEELKKKIDVQITEDEILYYRNNHFPSDIQTMLVRSVFADSFASYRDMNKQLLIDNRLCQS